MASHYYMALQGVGDWRFTMGEAGAQLAPYRNYLSTAQKSADNRTLSLAWRELDAKERRDLDRRLYGDEPSSPASEHVPHGQTHDRPARPEAGVWIKLEPPPGRSEEPESTFEEFFKAKKLSDQPGDVPLHLRITVLRADVEARALLLGRLPDRPDVEETGSEAPSHAQAKARQTLGLLFLRPNTWPLKCRFEALRELEDRPCSRLAPLVRLVSTRPSWPNLEPGSLEDERWVFLRALRDGSLRDGTQEQRAFVQRALSTPDFAILEGPPGSGKTTAICELIVQAARRGQRVMLVASTHVAVDNVLQRIMEWQDESAEKLLMPVRIGDDSDVTSNAAAAWTLSNLKRTWTNEVRGFLAKPRGGRSAGDGARKMLREALADDAQASALERLILEASNLVCGTTIGILQHPSIKAARRQGGGMEPFDLLILDEASKTTFPEFLVPALHARRWVVVGDARQLSPYVEEQDLADNLDGLLPRDTSFAAVHAFLASRPERQQRRFLLPVTADEQVALLSREAKARGVTVLDLDRAQPAPLHGMDGACAPLLYADLVCSRPETLTRWQHRLPADLEPVEGVPDLPDWQAHRRALEVASPPDPASWGSEMAWRLVRLHELRSARGDEAAHLARQVDELLPHALDEVAFFRDRRQRQSRDGQPWTARETLAEELQVARRVAMPSVLDVLQSGAGPMNGWADRTALTHGLPPSVLAQRMVSLSFQHRMHPDIAAFPRQEFYAQDGLLKDAAGMREEREWAYSRYARRALWLDVPPGRHAGRGNVNFAEADTVMGELKAFVAWAASAPRPGKKPNAVWEVAVLTFYRAQEAELRRRLQQLSRQRGNTRNFHLPGPGGRVHVTLCTVDRFQGHEADLVLLSFVKSGSVGFLNSPNRINVALTRARYQLVLVGHRQWLASSRCKSALLQRLASSPFYDHDLHWEQQP